MVGTKVSGSDANEPILQENPDRFCMFPIKYTAVWEMYKKAEASFWTGMLRCCDVIHYFAAHALSFGLLRRFTSILTWCLA